MIFKSFLHCAKTRLLLLCQKQVKNISKCFFSTQNWTGEEKFLKIHPDVKKALKTKDPVVALESTIITHGMPYPENYETALEVETIVKKKSVVPATIAVIDGFIHIGLTEEDLHKLSISKSAVKISRRGLSASVGFKQTGGTTVSATMMLAHRCNIPIFVTGGIGGVHRNGENSLDISSDLTELGRTPVTVISAGVKSILDIEKTLEYLETQGVTVATYGKNNDFPAFFTPKSGSKSQMCVKTPVEAAKLVLASQDLGINSGCVIAVPLPEEFAASGEIIESAIKMAVKGAESSSISGPDTTPYILKRVNEITGGESLKANVALIKHNASVGAEIAVELAKRGSKNKDEKVSAVDVQVARHQRPVVFGGAAIDIIAKCTSDIIYEGPSNPADICYTLGGVGRNMAEGLARYGDRPIFISAIGDDGHGDMAKMEMESYMDVSYVETIPGSSSALYNAIISKEGALTVGVEDMGIFEKITVDIVKKNEDIISESPFVCIDANLPIDTISYICDFCKSKNIDLFFEPTGSLKAARPFVKGTKWKSITYMTPNLQEFEVIVSAVTGKNIKKINLNENGKFADSTLPEIYEACRPLLEHIYCVVVTLAGKGVATFVRDNTSRSGIKGTHYPLSSLPKLEWMYKPLVNVSGSGDAFAAAFIHGVLHKNTVDLCTKMGLVAAQWALRSKYPVPPELDESVFENIEYGNWKTSSL